MHPSVPVVLHKASLVIEHVNENTFTLWCSVVLSKTLDTFELVVEACSKNESLVCEGFSVVQYDLVLIGKDLLSGHANLCSTPVFNLRRYSTRFSLESWHVSMRDGEVQGWLQVDAILADECDL